MVPRRREAEFFRAVRRTLPQVSARGTIYASNYTPPHYEKDANGNMIFFPERGTFRVFGEYSVDKTGLKKFPSMFSVSPPYMPDIKYSPFEAGIVGLNAGSLVTPTQTSFQFQSPRSFSSRNEAQEFLNNIKTFIVPRFLSFP